MSTLVRANRLIIKRYTDEDKNLAWDKIIQAKNLLAEAFYTENNKYMVRKALQLYQESLALYPEYAETYIGLGYIAYLSDEIITAISFLHNALDIDSQNRDALNMMEYFKQGLEKKINSQNTKAADRTLEKVLDLKMPEPLKVKASKGFLTSVRKAFSW